MAVDYIHRTATMTLECDTCGMAEEFDGDFKYCISDAKREGWKFVKTSKGWVHYCCEACRLGEA